MLRNLVMLLVGGALGYKASENQHQLKEWWTQIKSRITEKLEAAERQD